jgi:mRNA interferase HigB
LQVYALHFASNERKISDMLVRNLLVLEEFLKKNAAARIPMRRWVDIARVAEWRSIIDTRRSWPSADAIKGTRLTCFNIGGNNFRLMTIVLDEQREVIVVELFTHAHYSRKYK